MKNSLGTIGFNQPISDHPCRPFVHGNGRCFILGSLETDSETEYIEGLSRGVLGGFCKEHQNVNGYIDVDILISGLRRCDLK